MPTAQTVTGARSTSAFRTAPGRRTQHCRFVVVEIQSRNIILLSLKGCFLFQRRYAPHGGRSKRSLVATGLHPVQEKCYPPFPQEELQSITVQCRREKRNERLRLHQQHGHFGNFVKSRFVARRNIRTKEAIRKIAPHQEATQTFGTRSYSDE